MPPRILRMNGKRHLLVSGGGDMVFLTKYGTIARQKRLLGIRADIRPAWQGTTELVSLGITRLINVGKRLKVGMNHFNPKPPGRNDLGAAKAKVPGSRRECRLPLW